jgi:hypothetical protein
MFNVLKRAAAGASRHVLFAAAVALLVADWAGTARATPIIPELSPGEIGGAMTLLSGGLLLLRERLRARN